MGLECCQGVTSLSGITATVVQTGNACTGVKSLECEDLRIRKTLPPLIPS
jgi:hypothetical protein